MEFSGAKLALFLGDDLLVIKRDDNPDIPWPGHWDLPGGGREGEETAQACVLRETVEEVGLQLGEADLIYSERYRRPHGWVWFFAARMDRALVDDVQLGSEGQGWDLMTPEDYCRHDLSIPHFAAALERFMSREDSAVRTV